MLIAELKGVQDIKQSPVGVAANDIGDKVDPTDAWIKFQTELEKLGFEKLGGGSFGAVFEKPGYPWVFKVFNNDPAYIAYLKYAIQNQNLSAVPTIKGNIVRINKSTYTVRIEKLYPLSGNNHKLAAALSHAPTLLTFWDYDDFVVSISKRWPDVATVLKGLTTIPGKFYTDLHEYNVMQRESGTPVITDPLVS